MLSKFRAEMFSMTLVADTPVALPRYAGSALRGAFGHAFLSVCCSMRENGCASCLLRETCAYARLFEPSPPADSERLSRNQDIPAPFVIEPPDGGTYRSGDRIEFGLVLIGQAIPYLPYFIVAFRECGERGIGASRGKFHIGEMWARNPLSGRSEKIYDGGDGMVHNVDLSFGFEDIVEEKETVRTLAVELLTPMRLKAQGHLVDRGPAFHVLYRNVLRRISSLAYFHCGEALELDYRQEIERAKAVQVAEARTHWWDWTRYSSRQRTKMKLGGLVGSVRYRGEEMEHFLPLLRLAEVVHVGKGCTFGLGKIRVRRVHE